MRQLAHPPRRSQPRSGAPLRGDLGNSLRPKLLHDFAPRCGGTRNCKLDDGSVSDCTLLTMTTKFSVGCLAVVGLALLAGCVSTIDGRKEAGLPFYKDKIDRRYDRPVQEVWQAAKDVISFQGALTSEDKLRNVLEGNVDTRTIWVRIEPVDPKTSVVTVQARTKGGNGDKDMASYLLEQIAVRLATGNLTPSAPAKRPS